MPGLTDESKPRLRGPKRASKIRKLFNLTKEDDVRKYVNVFRKVRAASCLLGSGPASAVPHQDKRHVFGCQCEQRCRRELACGCVP